MKKLLTAAAVVAIAFSGAASADSIFIDSGTDFGSNGSTQTGWFDSLQFTYASSSTLSDNDNNNVVSIGDTIVSNSGMAVATTQDSVLSTHATSLLGLGFGDDNGFWGGGSVTPGQWGVTFGFTNVQGQLTSSGFVYGSGTINLYTFDAYAVATAASGATDISANLTHLFDLDVAAGGDTGVATVFTGAVSNFFNNPNAFNIAYGNGSKTFPEASMLAGGLRFLTSNDTQGLVGQSYNGSSTLATNGQHEGSVTFSVPEPTSLAILGLGLLGFAGTRRRKS
jgi:hypothetical protein